MIDRALIAQNITTRRKQLDLKQNELAWRAKITPAAISQIEAGLRIPSLPVVIKLADALLCSIDYLVGRTDKVKGGKIRA